MERDPLAKLGGPDIARLLFIGGSTVPKVVEYLTQKDFYCFPTENNNGVIVSIDEVKGAVHPEVVTVTDREWLKSPKKVCLSPFPSEPE